MPIVIIDFMNMAHRARSGFVAGDHAVVFNFFRGLRSLVGQFAPSRVYVVLEGMPKARHDLLPEYKANRKVDPDKEAEMAKFFEQVDVIKELLKKRFPVSVIRHPRHEADDTIANLVRRSSSSVDWVIVSSDTDFIQLVERHGNVKLYNPVKKAFVEAPGTYPYVVWKALRGDPSDNIPGIPGCGDKTAARIAEQVGLPEFDAYLSKGDRMATFDRNLTLIQFAEWTDAEALDMTSSIPMKDWQTVKDVFESCDFKSMTSEPAWTKFTSTFERLWG